MRAMFLEFIGDRTTHYLDQQYMLGPSLLVAPVFVSDEEETEYYLPTGRWTSFYNPRRVVQGPTWIKEIVALDDIPLWVRQGSIILLGPEKTGKPDYELNKVLDAHVFELDDGQVVEVDVPTGKGATLEGVVRAERHGDKVTLSIPKGNVELAALTLHLSGFSVEGSKDARVEVRKSEREIVLNLQRS